MVCQLIADYYGREFHHKWASLKQTNKICWLASMFPNEMSVGITAIPRVAIRRNDLKPYAEKWWKFPLWKFAYFLRFWFRPCINYAWKGRAVVSPSPQLVRQSTNYTLKGGYRNFSFSFIGPVEHNVWWENSRNGSFGPKKCPKTQIANF